MTVIFSEAMAEAIPNYSEVAKYLAEVSMTATSNLSENLCVYQRGLCV